MNVTMETPSNPEGLVTGNLLSHYMAPYVIFGTDSRFQVTNEYYNLISKQIAYFMISEFWTFGLQNLFVRTREPFFSVMNLRTKEPSDS